MEQTSSVLLLLISTLIFVANGQKDLCSNVNCDKVRCLQGYDPFKCPEGHLYSSNSSLCDCCPACVKYRGLEETCNGNAITGDSIITVYFTPENMVSTVVPPVVNSSRCAPGLECKDSKCQRPIPESESPCKTQADETKLWSPSCDPDGSYSAVQCKSDGPAPRCFCYAKDGKRIFGWDLFDNRDKMGCACSRLVAELPGKDPNGDLMFHCSNNGNFDPLQCNNGVCYCVNIMTGQPKSDFVHETLWKTLPCYDTSMGNQFLRMCDSQSIAATNAEKEMSRHGGVGKISVPPCDPDGSYAPKQCEIGGSQCYCRTKNNDNISAYFIDASAAAAANMTCNCARDKVIFAELSKPHQFTCENTGNYQREQTVGNGDTICYIDSDGFFEYQCDY